MIQYKNIWISYWIQGGVVVLLAEHKTCKRSQVQLWLGTAAQ